MHTKILCMEQSHNFFFSNEALQKITDVLTRLKVVEPGDEQEKHMKKLIIGSSFCNIQFDVFVNFIKVALGRVKLDVSKVRKQSILMGDL